MKVILLPALLLVTPPLPTAATTVFSQYEPIADDAALDLDERSLIVRLALASEKGLLQAHDIYSKGGHSHPQAHLLLESGPDAKIPSGTAVSGETDTGDKVRATTLHHVEAGDTDMVVQYIVDDNSLPCQVGGSPKPDTSGCFAISGKLHIGDLGKFHYSYSTVLDNTNGQTIQHLSSKADKEFYDCDGSVCPVPIHKTFVNHYGASDYADKWIQAAFDGSRAVLGEKEFDFAELDSEGRSVAIRWGTVVLNVWMYVAASLDKASNMCADGAKEDARQIWDKAFSLYTGSKVDETDFGGYFLYNLAQIECQNFGTCKKGYMGPVNLEIIENFVLGKNRLGLEECDAVRGNAKRIRTLMTVPLIQGTLKIAYELDLENDGRQRTQGEAAAFLTSTIPIVNSCSSPNANIIYNDLGPGRAVEASYEVIKAALERSYDCIGITCADVGGLINIRGDGYLPRAEPCGVDLDLDEKEGDKDKDPSPSTSTTKYGASKENENGESGKNIPLIVGLSVGIPSLLVLAFAGGYFWRSYQKEFDTANTSGKPRGSGSETSDSSADDTGDKHII